LDITSASNLIGEFERPTVGILSTEPCGVASADTLTSLGKRTRRTASAVWRHHYRQPTPIKNSRGDRGNFHRVIIAPRSVMLRSRFSGRKNLRLDGRKRGSEPMRCRIRFVVGGFLVQDRDRTLAK